MQKKAQSHASYPPPSIPGYTSGPLTPGSGYVHPPGSVHIPSTMHGSMQNIHGGSWGGSQGSALPPIMAPNPYHPATITRMGGYGIDHDVDTGRASGIFCHQTAQQARDPNICSKDGLARRPTRSATSVEDLQIPCNETYKYLLNICMVPLNACLATLKLTLCRCR